MIMSDELKHYGTPRHSGRYPWGSGENPYQGDVGFLASVHKLKSQGVTELAIAKSYGMNTSQLRKEIAKASEAKRAYEVSEVVRLKDKGYSNTAIGRRLGINESSVRSLLNPVLQSRMELTKTNASALRDAVTKANYIDVGSGVEQYLGITQTKLNNALYLLKQEGYEVHTIPVEQMGTGKYTNVKVLCAPGTEWKDVMKNKDQIHPPFDLYSEDGGRTLRPFEPPKSISSDRVLCTYKENGGSEKDGLIELRRGVEDISLGKANYAQVRIAVDGTHYMKGMAVYKDDMPDGVDIIFNTSKSIEKGKLGVMKEMKADPENPFGANIKSDEKLLLAQRHYIDKDGKEQLSALNIVNEEGDWNRWHKSLSSQFLSKQSPALAKQQLDMAHNIAKDKFDDIMNMTNPTVKRKLLEDFASECDSDASDLAAAALPRQATKAILPFPSIKEGEVFAPHLRDGETVALVRYPHAGTFEIPILTVNNKNKEARATIGTNPLDAIGINLSAATKLSGADFDGDSVLVIPCDKTKIKSSNPLPGLKDFDFHEIYKGYEGMHIMTDREKGIEMGSVSNLITDMTIKGAPLSDIERAVKHSMVVIDAQKHQLDYKRSEIENGIPELKEKWQGGKRAGASTFVSRVRGDVTIPQRKEKYYSNMTDDEKRRWKEGELIYEDTGKTRTRKDKKTGEYIPVGITEKVSRGSLYSDAYDLVKGGRENSTRIEHIYADYSNSMKALANLARKEARALKDIEVNTKAREVYADEVSDLKAQLNQALKNAPLERQAQLIAGTNFKLKLFANPGMDNEHMKRLRGQELDIARKKVGAGKKQIYITDRQWEAIMAGAVNKTTLEKILLNADSDRVRKLATPKTSVAMSASKIARAKSFLAKGYTQAEVADMLDVSVTTLVKAVT